jgi:hypothetical protein
MGEVSLDPVAVSVALVTLLVGPQLAAYVGPYVVIGAAGMTGAAFALSRREPGRRLGALAYMVVMTLLSVLLTVPAALVIEKMSSEFSAAWTLGPIALAIGYFGDQLPDIARWFGARLARVIETRTGGQ